MESPRKKSLSYILISCAFLLFQFIPTAWSSNTDMPTNVKITSGFLKNGVYYVNLPITFQWDNMNADNYQYQIKANDTRMIIDWTNASLNRINPPTMLLNSISTTKPQPYSFVVRSGDSTFGNYSVSSSTVKFTFDLNAPVAPIINAVTPINNKVPTWGWSATDNSGESGIMKIDCQVVHNGTDFFLGSNNNPIGSYTPAAPLNDGYYLLKVTAYDWAGNYSSNNKTIIIDTTAPVIQTFNIEQNLDNPLQPVWTCTANDGIYGSGIKNYQYKLDDAANWSNPTTNHIYQPTTNLSEGSHRLSVLVTDNVGLTAMAASLINIGRNRPELGDIIVTPSGATRNTQPFWSWNASGDVIRYKITLTKDGATFFINEAYPSNSYQPTLTDGVYQLAVIAVDSLGNESIAKSSDTVTVDTIGPDLGSIIVIPSGSTRDTQPVWSWNAASDAIKYKIVLTKNGIPCFSEDNYTKNIYQPTLTDGEYQLTVIAADSLGNESAAESSEIVTVDTAGPELGDINVTPSGPTKNTQPVWSWNASADAVSYQITLTKNGIRCFSDDDYPANSYQPSLTDGIYRLTVIAVDSLGNESSAKYSETVTIDATGPKLGVITVTPTGSTNNPEPLWIWEAPPDTLGYKIVLFKDKSIYFSNDAYTNTSYQQLLDDGAYQLSVIAYDELGNESAVQKSQEVTIKTRRPELSDITVTPAGITNNSQPLWSWNGTAGLIYKIELFKNGAVEFQDTAYSGTSYQAKLIDGAYQLTVCAVDELGNESVVKRSATVTIDTTGPELGNIKANATGLTNDPQLSWQWDAPVDAASYKIILLKDGNEYFRDDNYSDTSYHQTLSDGTYQLAVIAVDALGNESSIRNSAEATIKTNRPELSDINVVPSGITNNSKLEWSWSASYAITYKIELFKDGFVESTDNCYSKTSYQSNLPDGSYQLTVIALDGFGNESILKASPVVTVDTQPPVAPFINSPTTCGDSVVYTLTWTGTNQDSSFDHYEVLVDSDALPVYSGSDRKYQYPLLKDKATFEVVVYDKAGNRNTSGLFTVTRTQAVSDLPDIPKITSRSITNSSNYTLTWRGGDEGSTFDRYEIFVGSDVTPAITTVKNLEVVLSETQTTFKVVAYDKLGNHSSSELFNVTLDTDTPAPPEIITSHCSKSPNYTLTWTSNDKDTDRYEVFAGANHVYSGSEQQCFVTLSEPVTIFKVMAIDKALNSSSSDLFNVTLDTVAPELIFKPADFEKVNITTGSTIMVTLLDTGTGIDPDSIQVKVDSAVVTPIRMMHNAQEWSIHYIYRGPFVPSHTVQVSVKDFAGNETNRSITFTLENKRLGFGFGRLRY